MQELQTTTSVNSHFSGKNPALRATYDELLKAIRQFGPVSEEFKKTSIHLVHASAFAGVATRKDCLILTIKSDRPIYSLRLYRSERVSTGRFHHEVKLTAPSDVDDELIGWLKQAYALSA
jgi:hypothetical protein